MCHDNAPIEKNDSVISLYTERRVRQRPPLVISRAQRLILTKLNMDRGNYAVILNIAQTLEQYGGVRV